MFQSKSNILSSIDYLFQFIDLYHEIDGLNIIGYQPNIILIQNALTIEEQCKVFESVEQNKISKYQNVNIKNTNNKFRYAHFMRLNPSQTQEYIQQYPVYDQTFQKIISIVNKYNDIKFSNLSQNEINNSNLLNFLSSDNIKERYISSLSYKAPNGMLAKHCDKKKEIVFLYSFGCTAQFFVKGKSMHHGLSFAFQSGDCLIFDASKNADIIHSIQSIQSNSCPKYLHKYPFLIDTRICLQTRCPF